MLFSVTPLLNLADSLTSPPLGRCSSWDSVKSKVDGPWTNQRIKVNSFVFKSTVKKTNCGQFAKVVSPEGSKMDGPKGCSWTVLSGRPKKLVVQKPQSGRTVQDGSKIIALRKGSVKSGWNWISICTSLITVHFGPKDHFWSFMTVHFGPKDHFWSLMTVFFLYDFHSLLICGSYDQVVQWFLTN